MRHGGSYIKDADGEARLVQRTEPATPTDPRAAQATETINQVAAAPDFNSEVNTLEDTE
jgi:hypothetical protein